MIQRIGEEWEGLARTLPQMDDGRSPVEFARMLSSVQQVRETLRAMCRLSVTRSTVRDAVREALLPVLAEMGPEALFPGVFAEVESLRARVDAALEAREAAPLPAPPAPIAAEEPALEPALESEPEPARESAFAAEVGERLSTFESRLRGVESGVGEAHFRLSEEVGERGRFQGRLGEEAAEARRGSAALQDGLGALGGELAALSTRIRKELEGHREDGASRLVALEAGFRQTVEDRVRALESSLREETRAGLEATLGAASEQLKAAQARLGSWVRRLEESFPTSIEGATAEVERRLREEMDAMALELAARLGEIQSALGRIEDTVPRRGDVTALEGRLVRLEGLLEEYSGRFDTLDGVGSDLGDVAQRLGDVQGILASVASGVSSVSSGVALVASDVASVHSKVEGVSSGVTSVGSQVSSVDARVASVASGVSSVASGVSSGAEQAERGIGALRDTVAGGLSELQGILQMGIQRWESDQSIMLERLSSIRDSLRDQLRQVGERVEDASEGLWGKLRGKEGGLRLSRDEWDRVSSKLEGIISGLESVLSRKRPPGSA